MVRQMHFRLLQDAFHSPGPAMDQGPADAGIGEDRAVFLPAAVLSLRQPALHQGLPGGCDIQALGRRRADRQRAVHRLPLLHGRLSLRRPQLQLGCPARSARGFGRKVTRPNMDIRAESEPSKNATSAPTWRRWACSPPASAAARWARFTTATRTKTRSPMPKARPSACRSCCWIAAVTGTWRNWAPSRASITCRRRIECTRRQAHRIKD